MKDLSNIKNIEFLRNKDEILQEVIFENNHFNISDYYENEHDAALGIITPDQVIRVYSIISHEQVCKNIYRLLYKDFDEFSNEEDIDWQQKATAYGNIILQHVRNEYLFIWFPKELHLFQRDSLHALLFQIKECCLRTNITLTYCIGNKICHSVEDVLWYIKNLEIDLTETKKIGKSVRHKR